MKNKMITWMILAIVWEKFLPHMIGTDCLNLEIDTEEQSLTSAYGDLQNTIQPYQAREHLLLWITRSLAKHGKVVLYTCGDNATISIEPKMYPAKGLAFCDFCEIPELMNILFIAND